MLSNSPSFRHLLLSAVAFSSSISSIRAFTKPYYPKRNFGISVSQSLSTKPQAGDIVTINYSLKTPEKQSADDIVLFDTGKDVSFALHSGNYLPGLHTLVSTLTPGESIEGATVDAGEGDKNPDLIITVPKAEGSGLDYNLIKVGTELMLANGMKAVVTELTDADFTIDANKPMAGASFLADVTLNTVKPGPSLRKFSYNPSGVTVDENNGSQYAVATFALGCFWGGELAFMREEGVVSTKVGYTHGEKENPTYEEVCSGTTGHTEGIQIVYDPNSVSFERLVNLTMERLGESKFKLNQAGNDRGTQYRHGVYYHDDEQKEVAEKILKSFGDGCVTECKPAEIFFDAEDYHQQYLLKGGQSARKRDATVIRCYG